MLRSIKGFLLFLALPLSLVAQAQTEDSTFADSAASLTDSDYLYDFDDEEGVGYPLNIENEDLSSFQVLDSMVETKRFVFNGEDHRPEKLNTRLELKMMQYLNTRGYQYYLMEAGWATEYFLKKYMLENDSASGEIIRTYYTGNFYNLFTGLKNWNQKKETTWKIIPVALDIERDAPLALRLLVHLLPEKEASDSLEMFIESLKIISGIEEINASRERHSNDANDEGYFDFGGTEFNFQFDDMDVINPDQQYFYFSLLNTVKDLTSRFRAREAEFKEFLGSNYPDFERTIRELENWQTWIYYESEQMPQSWVFREQYMEQNFRKNFASKPEAKGFGQFGRCHISRVTKTGDCGFAFFSSLNKRLISKTPVLESELLSIGIFYPGLEFGQENRDNGNVTDLFAQVERGQMSIFPFVEDYANDELNKKFSMVIVAKSYKAFDEADPDTYEYPASKKKSTKSGFYFGFGQQQWDFKNMNTHLGTNLKPNMNFYEFGFETRKNGGMAMIYSFGFLNEQTANLGDSVNIGVRGSYFNMRFGRDILRSRAFDLTPQIGLGYSEARLREERKDLPGSLLGPVTENRFANPAFVLELRMDLSINIGFVTLRGFAGYMQDVSSKYWVRDERKLKNTPSFSLSGLNYGGAVAVRF